MKKAVTLSLAVLCCFLLLAGCKIVKEYKIVVNEDGFDPGGISKAQRIEVAQAGERDALRVLETEEDIDTFVESVLVGDWKLAELPEGLEREGAFTFYQQGTVRPGGPEPKIHKICVLYSYKDAAYLSISTGLGNLDIPFSISESAADYLHSLLQ